MNSGDDLISVDLLVEAAWLTVDMESPGEAYRGEKDSGLGHSLGGDSSA